MLILYFLLLIFKCTEISIEKTTSADNLNDDVNPKIVIEISYAIKTDKELDNDELKAALNIVVESIKKEFEDMMPLTSERNDLNKLN